ncbi:MAG: hypothetical protein RLZ98_1872 [Pseudomonadota bacterium]|jgi:hypothetical protein
MPVLPYMIAVALFVSGCAATLARVPVPEALVDRATVGRLDNIRFWGDKLPDDFDKMVTLKSAQTKAARPHIVKPGARPLSFLALSGGGRDGAYGAGVLAGWTKAGTRPEFELVTGVSTGALTAPFAFLGPAHDPVLKEIYTTHSTKELVTAQALAGILGGPALTDNSGLKRLLNAHITPKILNAVAREYKRGRRLLIATTNLDAQRPVIWDMGAIAASNATGSLKLFRDVLLASAAIPGIFPPVMIEVSAGGKSYQELHVDGGTVGQVFFLPDGALKQPGIKRQLRRVKSNLYVILNGKLTPDFEKVEPTTIAIASRSMATLLKAQGNGDVFRLYATAQQNGMQFNLAAIPEKFDAKTTEPFDPVYMKALFEQGFADASGGYKWQKTPPGRL